MDVSSNVARAADADVERPVFPPSANDPRRGDAAKNTSPDGLFVDCACDAQWKAGDRVVATVDNPSYAPSLPAGTLGTVVCGSNTTNPPLLVSWDGWSEGHDGNGYCACPVFSAASNSGYFVECSEIAPAPPESITTVCSSNYSVGTRVEAVVDSPSSASGISAGDTGSVVCGYVPQAGEGIPLLVAWDGWSDGHSGNSMCTDPGLTLPGGLSDAWWVECSEVQPGSDVSCACDGVFESGDRVRAINDIMYGASVKIHAGRLGTVACGDLLTPPLLISWDDWQDGHNGYSECSCPAGGLSDASGWFVDCTAVAKEYSSLFADGFESGDTSTWSRTEGDWCPAGSSSEESDCPADGTDVSLDSNGGCNSSPHSFGSITPGETICATTATFVDVSSGTSRDTDWYHFDVPVEGSYTITVNGLSELTFGFVDEDGCTSPSFIASATSTPGVSSMVTTVLQPGAYSVFVALTVFDGIPCGSAANDYTVSLN